ncbi:MAG: hypothetical protein HUJ31_10625, partial [Pseudomonadales bacterium]|nr:hypothetical protein [Pseudomonadales bacterium]
FFFVLEPALIFHGPWTATLLAVVEALIAIFIIAAAIQRYWPLMGALRIGPVVQGLMISGGLLIGLPGLGPAAGNLTMALGGLLLLALVLVIARMRA